METTRLRSLWLPAAVLATFAASTCQAQQVIFDGNGYWYIDQFGNVQSMTWDRAFNPAAGRPQPGTDKPIFDQFGNLIGWEWIGFDGQVHSDIEVTNPTTGNTIFQSQRTGGQGNSWLPVTGVPTGPRSNTANNGMNARQHRSPRNRRVMAPPNNQQRSPPRGASNSQYPPRPRPGFVPPPRPGNSPVVRPGSPIRQGGAPFSRNAPPSRPRNVPIGGNQAQRRRPLSG